jgi:uncharacterized membrane protein YfcA
VISPVAELAILGAISIVAGVLGALLGLGGGIIIVPSLTLLLGIPIHDAIAASIVSVVATSSAAAATYIRDRVANVRVGLFLEVGAVAGAIVGALLASVVSGRFLYALFAVVIGYSAFSMARTRARGIARPPPPDVLADRLRLHGRYFDHVLGEMIEYRVSRVLVGLALMGLAGLASGLLGIGSGVLKVPALDSAMRLPMRASSATSNFMIGLTASASAALYFARGDAKPLLVAPVAVGVLVGASIGARLLRRVPEPLVRRLFVIVLVVVAVEMGERALV